MNADHHNVDLFMETACQYPKPSAEQQKQLQRQLDIFINLSRQVGDFTLQAVLRLLSVTGEISPLFEENWDNFRWDRGSFTPYTRGEYERDRNHILPSLLWYVAAMYCADLIRINAELQHILNQ